MDVNQAGVQTPVDVLQDRKAQCGRGKKMAALVTTGSLNPIHHGHVRQLELAADALENKGYSVVAGWISPSDAAWSGGKPHGSISNAHKLAMVKLAVAGHPWIRCSRWEIDSGMVDYPVVVNHIKKVVGEDVEVFYVCGSDHAKKCWLHNKAWAVVIGRPGHELPPGAYSCTYIATKQGDSDVSSTMIRAAAEQNSLDTVQHMVHPDVLEYLKAHRNEIWG